MAIEARFSAREVFQSNPNFAGDAFLSGLGNANLSPFKDIAQGIDAGLRTANAGLTLIDEFGPQAQERKRVALETQKAELTVKQKQADLAAIERQAIALEQEKILSTTRSDLTRQNVESKYATKLADKRNEFYRTLEQLPENDFAGYARLRSDPQYAGILNDPEVRKGLRQSDAIFAAQARASGTPEGKALYDQLTNVDTTNTAASIRSQDIAQERNRLTERGQNIRQAQGGGAGGKPMTNAQLGALLAATGTNDPKEAVRRASQAELITSEEGAVYKLGGRVIDIRDKAAFDAISAGKGMGARSGISAQPATAPAPAAAAPGAVSVQPRPAQQAQPATAPAQQQAPAAPPPPAVSLGDDGLASRPENVSAILNKVGVPISQTSKGREELAKVFAEVDKIQVVPSDSFIGKVFGDKDSTRMTTHAIGAANLIAQEAAAAIPDSALAASINNRRGTSGEVSAADIAKEREDKSRSISSRLATDITLAGHALRVEKIGRIKAQAQQLEVRKAQIDAVNNIAQAKGMTVEAVEGEIQKTVRQVMANQPNTSPEQARAAVIELYRKQNIR